MPAGDAAVAAGGKEAGGGGGEGSGTFCPKRTTHPWYKRLLWALPGTFVFLCYTVTTWPIVRHILIPFVAASPRLGWFSAVSYAVLLVVVLFCWLRVATGDAGGVPPEWLRRAARGEVSRRDQTYCHRCECPRPLRARHCGQCGRCVLAFDHHCPWTSNCIGWANKQFFLQYLVATTVFTGFATWLSLYKTLVIGPVTRGHYISACFKRSGLMGCLPELGHDMQVHGTALAELSVFVVFVLAIAFTVGTVVLGGYHLSLAWCNCTTVEDGLTPNEFDLGSKMANLRQVFGPSLGRGLFAMGLVSQGDGTDFPRPHLYKED